MLIGIEGELGGGKTLMMVRYLLQEYARKRKIMTNLKLNYASYLPLDIISLLEDNKELENVVLGIDELTVYVDCRLSMSKANRFFSYLVLQSRKRGVDIYYTTQDMSMIESRVTDHTYFFVLCEKIFDKNNKCVDDYRYYTIFDFRNRRKPYIDNFVMKIRPYYKYYDTDQIIEPIYAFKKPDK